MAIVYFIKLSNDLSLKLHIKYFDIQPFVTILQIEFKRIQNFILVGSNFYPTTCMRKDLKLECIVVQEGIYHFQAGIQPFMFIMKQHFSLI